MGKALLDYKDLIKELDEFIRTGHDALAIDKLKKLNIAEIPRDCRTTLAGIARRVTLPNLSIQFMLPILRPKIPIHPPPTAEEWAVYAAALTRVGAAQEAILILKPLSSMEAPEVLLYRAYAHFAHWDYDKSIPLLRKYLQHPKLSDYQRLVGRVNLAGAFVIEQRVNDAESILNELIETTRAGSLNLLLGNSHELMAQLMIQTKQFDLVEEHLKLAGQALSKTKSNYEFLTRKWDAISQVMKDKPSRESLGRLLEIQQEATRRREWETVRECDLYRAVAESNAKIFQRVFIGTPFKGYRRRIQRHHGARLPLPKDFAFQNFNELASPERFFDLTLVSSLKPGHMLYRFLKSLTSDFYRPLSVGNLASQLYPGEYFHPVATPARLANLAFRLRAKLNENKLPIHILSSNNDYRILLDEGIALVIPTKNQEINTFEVQLAKLKSTFPYQNFSVLDARQMIGSSASRVLKWARENQRFHNSGNGPSTRYRFRK